MISLANSLSFLDNPNINWKSVIIGFGIGQFLFQSYLEYRQLKVLKKPSPPASIKEEVSLEKFQNFQKYSIAKSKFSIYSSIYGLIQDLLVIKYDVLPKIWTYSNHLMTKIWLPKFMGGSITQSIIFIVVFQLATLFTKLPVSYYKNFVLEEKFGFNKLTIKLWVTDTFKSLGLSFVLGTPVLAALLKIIEYFNENFVFYVMGFVLIINLVAMTIMPTLIMPLFNKYEPLKEGELKTAIEDLAKQQAFPLNKLLVVDGSKRSSHSNAYFIGLPWSKQIVLYDTLIEQTELKETVAILAHEIGHWKLNHLPKMLAYAMTHTFLLFTLFGNFIKNKSLFQSFGFGNQQPILIGFLLFSDIYGPIESILTFLDNYISRFHEYQADEYALQCGYEKDLALALIKISKENLSGMAADKLYSIYHYSHPILPERLDALNYVSSEKISK
ncbi:unnamed protein product [Candida verbasci]|uniref:CAAX prenyl protease n=1 Tax=Candida verbasci TaxID=1227364 RepID=A0A9W4TZ35_9ASCO|nr:unnamed protein product [Candida verbasci]